MTGKKAKAELNARTTNSNRKNNNSDNSVSMAAHLNEATTSIDLASKKQLPVPATRGVEATKQQAPIAHTADSRENIDVRIVASQNVAKPRKRKAKALGQQIENAALSVENQQNSASKSKESKAVSFSSDKASFEIVQVMPVQVHSGISHVKKAEKLEAKDMQQQNVDSVNQQEESCAKTQTNYQVPIIESSKQPETNKQQTATPTTLPAIIQSQAKQQQPNSKPFKGDEPSEEVDAGIEVDGSSNSGGSLKDANEEHVSKLASVSPLAESPTMSSSSVSTSSESNNVSSKLNTKKKQLAANLNDIDADEEHLQMKLMKQQSNQSNQSGDSELTVVEGQPNFASAVRQPISQQINKVQRKMVKQVSVDNSVETSMCKLCNTHVYQMERMLAEKSLYHKKCFRCHQCKIQLQINNYASHEGQVYCKAHHRQIIQPPVRVDNVNDVDIVAKSSEPQVDDYLSHRGRLNALSFGFLSQNSTGTRKKQMIICENEPVELPKDVVRCNDKIEDCIGQIRVNLGNIKEKFEMASQESTPQSSPSVIIDKPSFNIKKTLMAFESKFNDNQTQPPNNTNVTQNHNHTNQVRPLIRKLVNGFASPQQDGDDADWQTNKTNSKPSRVTLQRSETLLSRLRKYESRIAGNSIDDDDDEDDEDDDDGDNDAEEQNYTFNNGHLGLGDNKNHNEDLASDFSQYDSDNSSNAKNSDKRTGRINSNVTSTKVIRNNSISRAKNHDAVIKNPSLFVNLSSLKSQWENGDICKRRNSIESDNEDADNTNSHHVNEQEQELIRLRQNLALRKNGKTSIVNIYQNAIDDSKRSQDENSNRECVDLLNSVNKQTFKFTRDEFLQMQNQLNNNSDRQCDAKESTKPVKSSARTNVLKERFEKGLASNANSFDSDSDKEEGRELSKLEKIRQDMLEDLSVFTEGEIKAREARSLFQQIDKSILSTAPNNVKRTVK